MAQAVFDLKRVFKDGPWQCDFILKLLILLKKSETFQESLGRMQKGSEVNLTAGAFTECGMFPCRGN